ncbi:MAG: phosphoglycerate mutase [Rhodoferax sp.]|nr:phosphoglycerate mutase [Betaproteobacteria bacterium]NCN97230.1 phosphoglycerate mutase [Rhodoferax sp.]OIP18466.1 MAG: hypothetical protein AUK50_06055 [Comamonadaceae bacterium CG2_30_57_122]PIZ23244.1 MAG: phosphoglycerate mutase [Comamonadaceae bacterium CG_4_10_14_0_8_um_filter_57_29]PJC20037.1 MAG: phosphoglycerate mutase [Comamonadaceae bacterium CG_4_9_14_0_8_um_filter_57_21]
MHLLIPYAASPEEGCQATLPSLQLPHLQKLLTRLSPEPLDAGDAFSLSPPHERALAKALALPASDGLIPWAAQQAQQHPALTKLTGAWAFLTLCNWQAHMKEVTLRQLPMQDLPSTESDALLQAMQPFFAEDGLTLYPFEPGCWLVHGAALATLPTASPERIHGRDLTPWMPRGAQASGLMRLLSEMQMLLYTHPVNDAREARGALPVNAFWLHGTGVLPPGFGTPSAPEAPTLVNALRDAALCGDWSTWSRAWVALDAEHGHALLQAHKRGEAITLSLCGERHAQTWHSQPQSLMQKVNGFLRPQPIQNMLKQL